MGPKFENAPGVNVRPRKSGWMVYWQARADIVKRGFRPPAVPLWRGEEPSDIDRVMVAEQCERLQAEMLTWSRGGLPTEPSNFDGTVESLVHCYKHDPDSPFHKLRYHSRINYGYFLKRIVADHGDEKIKNLSGRDMQHWHDDWVSNGKIPMAHGLVRSFRGLLSFGSAILDDPECDRLSSRLSKMRFKMGRPRESILTADQADMIRAKAHEKGLHSIALAQAFQFEGMLRQRDIIGEWVPKSEDGPVLFEWRDQKWQRGIIWSEIDAGLVLRHITSKRQKLIEIRLTDAQMVMEEFARIGDLPKFGPIIISELTGRPYSTNHFRQLWREIADECGIPKTVQNRDSRAGAITEATEAGAPLESIKHAANHSDISQTQQYARAPAEKTAVVHKMRAEHRKKNKNKGGT